MFDIILALLGTYDVKRWEIDMHEKDDIRLSVYCSQYTIPTCVISFDSMFIKANLLDSSDIETVSTTGEKIFDTVQRFFDYARYDSRFSALLDGFLHSPYGTKYIVKSTKEVNKLILQDKLKRVEHSVYLFSEDVKIEYMVDNKPYKSNDWIPVMQYASKICPGTERTFSNEGKLIITVHGPTICEALQTARENEANFLNTTDGKEFNEWSVSLNV